jgi:hypothetical protein
MTARKGLSKKTRFEVFKRDSFTCQYCGNSAPSVLLEVDHIKPVSKSGDNDITNLITSCVDCNRGKSDRELSDDTVALKRKKQLDELQARREQIEMMMDWRGTLDDIKEQELESLLAYINSKMPGYSVNESGSKKIKSALRKYGLSEMLECASISADQYIYKNKDDKYAFGSLEKYLDYIPKIARSREQIRNKPYLSELYRIKGILNYKGFGVDYQTMNMIESAYLGGITVETLETIAKQSNKYWEWEEKMNEVMDA